jgi:phytoene dehydrogenase-like protein
MEVIFDEIFDNIIIGAGAGGLAVAKLLSENSKENSTILFEQHFSPGGCGGYFARGNPKRVFDVGATQLVAIQNGEIQNKLYCLNKKGIIKFPISDKIENIYFHFPNDNTSISIDSKAKIEILAGKLEKNEDIILKNIIQFSNLTSKEIWIQLKYIPKFPIYSFKELFQNATIFFKMKNKIILFSTFFLSFLTVCKLLGLKNNFKKSHDILNSLLLDTVQNKMNYVPWIFGSMGISILNYGIYRLNGGMRSYFMNLAFQIQDKGIKINYQHELLSIEEDKKGFILSILDKKNNKIKKILTNKNLYLNITIWNFLKIYKEENSFKKKLIHKIENKSSWGACALFGFFENNEAFPNGPWYHQIFFEDNEIEELKSSLYLSVYKKEINNNIRCFTATIHFKINLYEHEKKEFYKNKLISRIEKTLKIKLQNCEFASPSTYEKFTIRDKGKVGGMITNAYDIIFKSIPSVYKHPNNTSKLFFVGDSVFPGQGIVSSTISGVIAWERATNLKFSELE